MSIESIIKRYQERVQLSKNNKAEINNIINEIVDEIYLDNDDKIIILDALRQVIITEQYEIFALDNKEYLLSIENAIKKLEAK